MCRSFSEDKRATCVSSRIIYPSVQLSLYPHASNIGVGAALMQKDHSSLEHPIAYFSRKFNKSQRNYCTSEKEALALVLALQHFEFFLSAAQHPVLVYTDHNPLTFLNQLRDKNQ